MTSVEDFLAAHESIASEAAHQPGEMFGEWRIVAFIGRGGSSEVYRAVRADGKTAALRIPLKGGAASAAQTPPGAAKAAPPLGETAALHLGTKYLPEIYESRPAFTAMELLAPAEGIAPAEYILGVAKAVRFLHSRGVVHRDLKPQNVMMRPGGGIVLIDIAAQGGTPRYAAPEQWQERVISPAADIHAMGVMLDAMFDGEPPRRWARIIRRATSSLPAQRFASVNDFIRAVRLRNLPFWLTAIFAIFAIVAAFFAALQQGEAASSRLQDSPSPADAEYERIIREALDADAID